MFDPDHVAGRAVLYAPGSAAFARLVSKMVSTGVHKVADRASEPEAAVRTIVGEWLHQFGGWPKQLSISSAERHFGGKLIVRVRASVQHDAYERILEVDCVPSQHAMRGGRAALLAVPPIIEDIASVGVDKSAVQVAAQMDPAVAEFRRFYLERRALEVQSAADDERKRHKLHEDFTPHLDLSVVGAEGTIERLAEVNVTYVLDEKHEYTDALSPDPDNRRILRQPEMRLAPAVDRLSLPIVLPPAASPARRF